MPICAPLLRNSVYIKYQPYSEEPESGAQIDRMACQTSCRVVYLDDDYPAALQAVRMSAFDSVCCWVQAVAVVVSLFAVRAYVGELRCGHEVGDDIVLFHL